MTYTTSNALLVAILLAPAFSTPAFAYDDRRCSHAPRAQWMSIEKIAGAASAQGYQVRGVEADDGCWEVSARDRSGKRVDLHYHPVTGSLVWKDFDG